MARASQQKGYREENNLVNKHRNAGIHAERVPLSGAVKYKGNGGDVDIYWQGEDHPPVTCELKARKDGKGFKQLEDWMGDHQVMFLKRNRQDPMVTMTWAMWLTMISLLQPELRETEDE